MGKHEIQDLLYRSTKPLLGQVELRILSGGCGLFGDFFMTLDGLLFCEKAGLVGRPHWTRRSLYFDGAHGNNAWDLFFEPIVQQERSLFLPYFPSARHFQPEDGRSARQVAASAIARFGRARPELIEMARRFSDEHLQGGDYIGVHVRGTDARAGAEGRQAAEASALDAALDEEISKHPSRMIFLATDEERTLAAFRERFGDRVRARSCIRSSDGKSVHGHYDQGQTGSPYQKGVDVVVDALLLAWGKHLIRGHSRVTMYSLALNPELTFTDVDVLRGEKPRAPWLYD
jgi:hypothetical protein